MQRFSDLLGVHHLFGPKDLVLEMDKLRSSKKVGPVPAQGSGPSIDVCFVS